ncbi:MAG: hypothetical protein U1D55_09105 [Phycisphaerae bacterium]
MSSAVAHDHVDESMSSGLARWLRRGRYLLAIGAIWAGLHWVANASGALASPHRPIVLLAGQSGFLPLISFVAVILIGALAARAVLGFQTVEERLIICGLALTLFAFGSGVMDDWLVYCQPRTSPPSGAPYTRLIPDYLLLLAVFGGVAMWGRGAPPVKTGASATQPGLANGPLATLVTAAVAAILIMILMGPRVGPTYRGQVYFAVALGIGGGVAAAFRLTGVREPAWYSLAPFVVGIVGLVLAAISPGLPQPYDRLNIIPASAVARPLPIEMVGMGVTAAMVAIRSSRRVWAHAAR